MWTLENKNDEVLEFKVYDQSSNNESEKIISIAKDICLDRIKKTEEKIKKGDYSTKIKKHFWSPDEVYCSVYVDPIDYHVVINSDKNTPYYFGGTVHLLEKEAELYKNTIISMLKKEGFTCRFVEQSWGTRLLLSLILNGKRNKNYLNI